MAISNTSTASSSRLWMGQIWTRRHRTRTAAEVTLGGEGHRGFADLPTPTGSTAPPSLDNGPVRAVRRLRFRTNVDFRTHRLEALRGGVPTPAGDAVTCTSLKPVPREAVNPCLLTDPVYLPPQAGTF